MKRSRLLLTVLGCLLACVISVATIAAENLDSHPYALLTPIAVVPKAELHASPPVRSNDPGQVDNWISDEIWLICSVVIALVGITIMRKTIN
ncbi:MAG: hypothetical protein OEN52_01945 [Gammaproteobacteria bacterium]|nr:hypothetical protein [Gammaproteobacteria bacterium]